MGGWIPDGVEDKLKGAANTVVGKAEEVYDDGKKLVGEGIDRGTDYAGERLEDMGLKGVADKVEDWGDGAASALGATPGEQQLGETEQANELVHGNVGRIQERQAPQGLPHGLRQGRRRHAHTGLLQLEGTGGRDLP